MLRLAHGWARRAPLGVDPLVVAPVHEVGRVAADPHTGPRITRAPWGVTGYGGWRRGRHAQCSSVQPRVPIPYAQPVKDAIRTPATSTGGNYLTILVTCPAPTVRPPSRMANCRPSSMAIGWISFTSILVLSPGMTISVPEGRVTTPVTSVVRK